MNLTKKVSLALLIIFYCLANTVSLARNIPVEAQASLAIASIQASINNAQSNAKTSVFLSNEQLQLSFELNIADEDVGFASELYLLARKNNDYFIRNEQGHWLLWDYPNAGLLANQKKTLSQHETLSVLDKQSLQTGEYFVYAGYLTRSGDIKYNRLPITFLVMNDAQPTLHSIKNRVVLESYLSSSSSPQPPIDSIFAGAPTSSISAPQGISVTNIQENNVDESDTIKTKNNILFALESCTGSTRPAPIIAGPVPATNVVNENSVCLSQYALSSAPAGSTLLAKKELGGDSYNKGSLYLHETNDNNQSDQLIWLYDSMQYNIQAAWGAPLYWSNNETHLSFFNLSQDNSITSTKTLSIEGAIVASRRIADKLYLITRTNSSQLPQITFDKTSAQPLVTADNCYLPVTKSTQAYDGTLINITTIPINEPENYQSTCIAGNINTAYVSSNALYLASSRYNHSTINNVVAYEPIENYTTDIHKFSFTDEHIEYNGSGSVLGHLGWDEDKMSFRMGENNGILKVATSLGKTWSNTATTRVGVFKENTELKRLDEISHLDNLGKPGEKLYSARFIADRGYLVTFRVTDPLYLLDFSEPEAPKILGELEINGYSDYLHPIGDHFLLGIGKEAIADPDSNDLGGRGAWYQGVKLSLFDVSNGAALREVQSIVIGQRGSSSEVLFDHHAFAFLASEDAEHFRLSIPISENNTANDSVIYDHPSKAYQWTQTGAYIFDLHTGETPSLTLADSLITESRDLGDERVSSQNDRVILQDNAVHYVHDNQVFSAQVQP